MGVCFTFEGGIYVLFVLLLILVIAISLRRFEKMSDISKTKEVYFDKYCKLCDHKDVNEKDEPCNTCLYYPINEYSHIPVNYSGPKPLAKKDWVEK